MALDVPEVILDNTFDEWRLRTNSIISEAVDEEQANTIANTVANSVANTIANTVANSVADSRQTIRQSEVPTDTDGTSPGHVWYIY